MKTRGIIWLEGACYVIIAAGAPFGELLISDRPLNSRTLAAAGVMALIAAAANLKAFLSQSMQSKEPMRVEAPPGKPLEVTES